MVVNSDGIPIKTTLDNHLTTQYAGLINQLVDQAKAMFKEMDSANDLTFLRMRTKKHEILVAPDKEYLLIVIQASPHDQALLCQMGNAEK